MSTPFFSSVVTRKNLTLSLWCGLGALVSLQANAAHPKSFARLMPRECPYEEVTASMSGKEKARLAQALLQRPAGIIPVNAGRTNIQVRRFVKAANGKMISLERKILPDDLNKTIYVYDPVANACGYSKLQNTAFGRWLKSEFDYQMKNGLPLEVIRPPVIRSGLLEDPSRWRTLQLGAMAHLFDRTAQSGYSAAMEIRERIANSDEPPLSSSAAREYQEIERSFLAFYGVPLNSPTSAPTFAP